MTYEEPILDLLVREYRKGGAFAATVAYFANRKRAPRDKETKVSNLQSDLARSGNRYSVEELQKTLETFDAANCGTYHRGRPLENSRLQWQVSARIIASRVTAAALPDQGRNGQLTGECCNNVEMETHDFPVRRGVRLPIQVRTDMSASELNNLADYIRVIAASRRAEHESATA